ncbi:MAG: type IV pilus assembly protein PilM, partial [Bradymonadia bacterium]
ETSLRSYEVVEVVEEPIVLPPSEEEPEHADPDGAEGPPEAEAPIADPTELYGFGEPTLAALRALSSRGVFEADAVFAALRHGDALITRLELPFGSKREIEPILAPQLEGKLPTDVEEVLLDSMVGGRHESGEYAVYASAIEPARLAIMLAELESVGVDPKVLDVQPFPLLTVGRALTPEGQGPVAIIDVGAEQIGVVVFHGKDLQYARTFSGGGERFTAALADVFGLDPLTAREGKHREGFIDVGTDEVDSATGNDATDISNACRRAAKPLIRQLRRTLQGHASEWGRSVEHIYVTGGSSLLPGLVEYLGQSLGVPASPLPFDNVSSIAGFTEVGNKFATALGLGLRGVTGVDGSDLNARIGPFSFKGSYEHIRSRLPQMLGAIVVLVMLSLAFVAGRIVMLKAESAALDDALAEATEPLFGEAVTNGDRIRGRFALEASPPRFLPQQSAFALWSEIANAFIETADLGYEVEAGAFEVDLERRVYRVEGVADSAESVDTFETQLAAIDCVSSVNRNEMSASGENFEFSINGALCGSDDD